MHFTRRVSRCLAVAGVLALPTLAAAQAVDVAVVEPVDHEATYRINTGYLHGFDADIDGNKSDFNVDSARFGFGADVDLSNQLSWDNYFNYEFDSYDFSGGIACSSFRCGAASSVGGWNDIHSFGLTSLFKYAVDDWRIYGGGLFRFAGESDADFANAAIGGGVAGFNYVHSSTLVYGLGLAVVSQLESSVAIVPIPTVMWKFADQWTLHGGISELGPRVGLGVDVAWELAENWTLTTGAQFQRKRFRLNDHPGLAKNGVGEDSSVPLFAKVTWKCTPSLNVELIGGAAVAGNLRVETKSGGKLSDEDYDAAPLLGVRLNVPF